ncbi:centrin [Salix suchowensis]|nr:centrin [Salix suchowensis]
MATSLMGSVQKSRQRKGKQKFVDDEEYKPNDETACDDDDDDDDFDDEDFVGGQSSSKSWRSKGKRKSSKPEKTPVRSMLVAIALSLRDSPNNATPKERKVDAHVQEDAGRRKRKKSLSSRVQMTEDDLILHFFQFDEAGKGAITMRDLRRVANAHDFTWTDKELADMIHCFDGDGDGKLTLDDFLLWRVSKVQSAFGKCSVESGLCAKM